MEEAAVRRDYVFFGHVQGVGFRRRVQSLARRLPVQGFVRNLPNGSVELSVEGPVAELDRLETRIASALGSHIERIERSEGPATGEFALFAIRYD